MKTFVRFALFALAVLLVLSLIIPVGYRLVSGIWNWGFGPTKTASTSQPVCREENLEPVLNSDRQVFTDSCLYEAGRLGFPSEIASKICNGTTGNVSLQLQSGTFVPFGTFTMDAESRVWILSDFTVPAVANYSFSYENAERNLLQAPFILGSELGWKGQERVPFTVCYNFEGECSLPNEVVAQLFPTK